MFLYMFRSLLCSSSGGQNLYYTASGIVTLCRWPFGAQVVHRTTTYKCDDTRCYIVQFDLLMMSTTVLETFTGI